MKIEHIIVVIIASMLLFGLLSLKVLSKEKWESSYRQQHWFQGFFLTIGALLIFSLAIGLTAIYDSNRTNVRKSECRSQNLPVLVDSDYTQKEISDILGVTCK